MNTQNLLKDPNTNWKYIIIVLVLAFLVGGGILGYQYLWLPRQEIEMPEIEIPEREVPEEVEVPADWKTFENKGHGYEIKYPKEWKTTSCATALCVKFIPQVLPKEVYYDSLEIEIKNRQGTILADWISGEAEGGGREDFPYIKRKDVIVAGIKTEMLDDPVTMGVRDWKVVFLLKGDLVYKITTSFSEEEFEQILSTFKFIEIPGECAKEGESPYTIFGCCPGLRGRYITHPMRDKANEVVCVENMTAEICVKCGDGICGKGEDWCICPEDCKKPSPLELYPF